MIQLHVDGTCSDDPGDVAEAFAKHFYATYSHTSPPPSSVTVSCSDFLPLVSVSKYDIHKAIKRLTPKKSAGLDDIPGFTIKGCSTILMPILKFIFNLSVSQKHFPNQWKQSVIVPVYKQGNKVSFKNYRPVSLLSNFSNVFELIIHDHLFYYFKNKLSPS